MYFPLPAYPFGVAGAAARVGRRNALHTKLAGGIMLKIWPGGVYSETESPLIAGDRDT